VNKGDDKVATFYSTNGHDSVEDIPKDYDMIVKQSQELCKQIAGFEKKQILILQTTDNKIHKAIVDYSFASDSDAAEQAVINIIEKNTIIRLVCCWADGAFDVPSYNFRKKLCELNPNNETAQMLLNGEHTFILKTIRDFSPKKNASKTFHL
jgi:hypothetical protein